MPYVLAAAEQPPQPVEETLHLPMRKCRCLAAASFSCDNQGLIAIFEDSRSRPLNSDSCMGGGRVHGAVHICMCGHPENLQRLGSFLSFSLHQVRQCLLRENGDGGLVRRMTSSRAECKFNVNALLLILGFSHHGCIFSPPDDGLKTNDQCHMTKDKSVQNWNDIAVLLPGRTNKDCRKRWSKVQLDIRKGAWTRDEDGRLQQAVQQLGFKLVASRLFPRLIVQSWFTVLTLTIYHFVDGLKWPPWCKVVMQTVSEWLSIM